MQPNKAKNLSGKKFRSRHQLSSTPTTKCQLSAPSASSPPPPAACSPLARSPPSRARCSPPSQHASPPPQPHGPSQSLPANSEREQVSLPSICLYILCAPGANPCPADIALSQKLQEELNYEKEANAEVSGTPEFLKAFQDQGVWEVSLVPFCCHSCWS